MSVWGGRDPRPVDVAAIAEEMKPALEQWFSGQVKIWDDDLLTATPYDSLTDTGGQSTPTLVLDSGANGALVQPIRSPNKADFGGQAGSIMGVRFQVKRAASASAVLRAGLRVEVVSGGNDAALTSYTYQLLDSLDGSLAWDRILEATVSAGSTGG